VRARPVEAVRRVSATLALALCLLGCQSEVLPWDRVQLVTGGDPGTGCGLMPRMGDLTADPAFGTTLGGGAAVWPSGYTGRRVGSEVEVLDRSGKVVATTGQRYQFYFVYVAGKGGAGDPAHGNSPDVICDIYPCTPSCPIEHGGIDNGDRVARGSFTGHFAQGSLDMTTETPLAT
jgi:hypothetical protein